MTQLYRLKRGDIGGYRGRKFPSRIILRRKRKEGKVEKTSHVWRVVEDGEFSTKPGPNDAQIVEALLFGGIKPPHSMSASYGAVMEDVWVARPVNLTAEELGEIVGWTLGQVGKKYSKWMIFLHLIGREDLIPTNSDHGICSYIVSKAERRIEKFFGDRTKEADPQDIERFIAAHLGATHVWVKRPSWRPLS